MVNELFALNDLYNSGMRGVDYYWGSNDVKMAYGIELVWAAKLGATGAYSGTQCLRHAEDFLHYMDGANPLNMTYMTNSAVLGASHGIWRIYHQWFGNYDVPFSYHRFMGKPSSVVDPLYPYFAGTDNFGVSDSGPSTYGPPPGIVTDGPSREYYSFGLKAIPPLLAGGAEPPYEKAYRDWNYVGPRRSKTQPWVVNETGIYYISSYTALASAFVDQFEKKEARGRQ
jgi:hypothetical protein